MKSEIFAQVNSEDGRHHHLMNADGAEVHNVAFPFHTLSFCVLHSLSFYLSPLYFYFLCVLYLAPLAVGSYESNHSKS